MIKAYIKMFKNGFDFSSRTTRKDFWLAILCSIIIDVILYVIATYFLEESIVFSVFTILYNIVLLIPRTAINVRRLHDIGKSGWWILIGLVPLGAIVLLVFSLTGSDYDNRFGEAEPVITNYPINESYFR